MSRENIQSFFEKARTSPELQGKITEIYGAMARSTAESLARLATDSDLPFTVDEFLAAGEAKSQELSEGEMSQVSGGAVRSYRIGGKNDNNGFVDTSFFDPLTDFLADLRRRVRGEDF